MRLASSHHKLVENLCPFSQGMIEQEFTIGVNDVENQIGNWNVSHQTPADLFSSEPLLERAERQSATGARQARVRLPGNDLSIENRVFGQVR